MKKIYVIITIVFLSSYSCKAQVNKLTRTEYYNIRINDVTFQSIYDTNGDEASMKALFRSDLEFEFENDILISKQFWNNNFTINFDSDEGNYYFITFINIHSYSSTVTVKGITVKLGDDKSIFGSLLVNTNTNSIIFVDEETGTSSLAFRINPATNKIIKIDFNSF